MPTPTAEEVWDDLVADIKRRREAAKEHHSYWMGEQDLPINTSEFKTRFGNVFSAFRANLARPVISIAEGRIRFKEFGNGSGLAEDALEVWRRNKMPVESKAVTTDALVMGDAFVIVMPDEEDQAGIYPQISTQMALIYDRVDPRKKLAAMKWWVEDLDEGTSKPIRKVRVNFYFEDRIERYVSKTESESLEDSFSRYVAYSDEDTNPVTRHDVGEVPVFRFPANWDTTTQSGRSDLADVTGLIDAITKTILDLLVASEYTAAPQRWATGVEIPLDPKTGEPLEAYKAGADRLWTAPNDGAKFGQFGSSDLTGFREAIETLVDQIAFVSATPLYALMRSEEVPAGEALKTAEMPLRQRVGDHQEAFGQVWSEVMRAALRLEGIEVEDLSEVAPAWLPVNAPFTTRELLEELKVHVEVLGVPEEMAWRRAGYTNTEIEEMRAMRQEEATLGQDATAAFQADAVVNGAPPATEATAGISDDIVEDPTLAPQ